MNGRHAILCFIAFFCTAGLAAQTIARDAAYGNSGIARIGFSIDKLSVGIRLFCDASGNVKIAGNAQRPGGVMKFALVAFDSAGQPENAFNGSSKVTWNLVDTASTEEVMLTAIRYEDGRYLLGGFFEYSNKEKHGVVLAVKSDGLIDSMWGENGFRILNFGAKTELISLQSEGSLIYAACNVSESGKLDHVRVMRLFSDGKTDSSFAENGVAAIRTPKNLYATGILPHAGKLVMCGYTSDVNSYPYLSRLQGNGEPDSSFGTNGVAEFFNFTDGRIQNLTRDEQGRIYGIGFNQYSKNRFMVVVRYTDSGKPDRDWPVSGHKEFKTGGTYEVLNDIKLLPDGKVLLLGVSDPASGGLWQTVLVLFDTAGNFVYSFGNQGKWIERLGNRNDDSRNLSVDEKGRIYIGGSWYQYSAVSQMMSCRLVYDPVSDIKQHVEGSLSIYPNPAGQSFMLKIPESAGNVGELQMIDAGGKLVFSKSVTAETGSLRMDINDTMLAGCYLVRVIFPDAVYSGRLLIGHE